LLDQIGGDNLCGTLGEALATTRAHLGLASAEPRTAPAKAMAG
jgi:hypothetical protein